MANLQGPRMEGASGKTSLRWALLLLAAALAAGGFWVLMQRPAQEQPVNADLCPEDAADLAGSASLLLDLRKPLHTAAPGTMLRQLSRDLGAGMELQVFTLTGDARAPRRFVQRLCKPYDNADLTVKTAKDQRQAVRDCDDPPAQLPPQLREAVTAFCTQRDALAARLDRLANAVPQTQPVVNAYLIEAVEETKRAFADRPQPWALHLYSDMLQHAAWYSHLDLDWTQWRFADFEPLRNARQPPPQTAAEADLQVKVFYLPRRGLTEPARQRRAHQGFWRAYFNGADLDFADAPPLPAYSALPLMSGLTEGASAEDLEQIERQREETERLLERMAEEQAALDEQRRQEIDNEQLRAARQAELRRLEQAVATARQRQQELAAGEATPAEPTDAPLAAVTPPAEPLEEEIAAPPPPAPSAESAVAAAQPAEALAPAAPAVPPPCPANLKPEFLASLEADGYPGGQRVNYGAGTIAVRYTLGDDGSTLDGEVLLQRDQSSSTRPAYFVPLVEDTLAAVRAWEFDFDDAAAPSCAKRQQQTATFTYRSKCVGSPVPSCRTVQAEVALYSAP